MDGTTTRPGPSRVVVGVDGSPSARTVVMWAAAEASLRGSTLFLVHAAETDGQAARDHVRIMASVSDRLREEFPKLTVHADGQKSPSVPGASWTRRTTQTFRSSVVDVRPDTPERPSAGPRRACRSTPTASWSSSLGKGPDTGAPHDTHHGSP
ncbi:universal stress protein [Streptomyces sp. NPDC059352]|uniref:universal stress protein n=1 Tax=Streptomyces sp. NPDC059352 TaxID=3346810 RepID=UPI0036B1E1EB